MRIKISEIVKTSRKILAGYGFTKEQAETTVENVIEAELSGKPSHGLLRIPAIKSQKEKGTFKLGSKYSIISKSSNHLYIDGKDLPGWYLLHKSLELSLSKAPGKIFAVGIKDAGYATGYVGAYARMAANKNLIFIGFNNSVGWTTPFGSKKGAWGTNPITVGIPATKYPVVYDAATSKWSVGEVLIHRALGKPIPEGIAFDSNGNFTTDANEAYLAKSMLPIAEHKGSGLVFIVELLAGALTNSRVGYSVSGVWGGCSYILIDPSIFRPIKDFKRDVDTAIKELKNLPKAKGVKEIFYPGERSGKLREKHIKQEWIDVDDNLWGEIYNLRG